MRVLGACSLGGAGHLNPLLPVLAAAARGGDEVLVVAPESLRALVSESGLRASFLAGGEPPESEVAPIRERLPTAPAGEASVLGNRELFGRLATTAMLPAMAEAFSSWLPDLVLREPCEYASAVLAMDTGTPAAQVAISLAEGEASSIASAAPALEQHRSGLVESLLASPYLTRFPESLDPSPFLRTIRFSERPAVTRPVLPGSSKDPDLPLVYVTLGSVFGYMESAAPVYRAVVEAVAPLPVRVLLTLGRRLDPAALGPLPANVQVESWVDHASVLGGVAAVVCHGGSGTVLDALSSGLPLVVVPLFADQFQNGERVERLGAGVVVKPDEPAGGAGPRRLVGSDEVPALRRTVARVLGEDSYRLSAGRIAAEMAALPGPGSAFRAAASPAG